MHPWTDVVLDVRGVTGSTVPRHSGVVLTPVLSHSLGLGLLDSCRPALRYRLSPAGDLAGCAPHACQNPRNLGDYYKRVSHLLNITNENARLSAPTNVHFHLLLFILTSTPLATGAAMSPEDQEGHDEERNHEDIGQDVDDRAPHGCLLWSGANHRRVEAGNNKVRVPTDKDRIDDLLPGHIEHSDIPPPNATKPSCPSLVIAPDCGATPGW